MQEEVDSPHLHILPPLPGPLPEPSPYIITSDFYDRSFRKIQEIKALKDRLASEKEKEWLRGLPQTEKTDILTKFGDVCGPSIALAKIEKMDALPIL